MRISDWSSDVCSSDLALAAACQTPWLLTVPVDVVDVNDCLVLSLRAAGPGGAWAEDDDGPQPLVALWPVEILRTEVAKTVASGDFAVPALPARRGMTPVRLAGLRRWGGRRVGRGGVGTWRSWGG